MAIRIFIRKYNVLSLLARRNRNISWLAEKIGVSRTTMSMWLARRKCPNEDNRRKFQSVCNKSWDYLFEYRGGTSTSL